MLQRREYGESYPKKVCSYYGEWVDTVDHVPSKVFLDKSCLLYLAARSVIKSSARMREGQIDLNALEPGTVMPIHRHRKTSETICMVRGKMVMRLYDDKGNVTDEFVMEPCGEHPMVQVEAGQWHSLEVLEEGTVIFEAKDGKYEPLKEEKLMKR